MPTFRHGRLGYIAIQGLDSVMVNISNVLKSAQLNITLDTPETTAFGSTFKSYVVGIKDGKFDCSGMFDATADTLLNNIYGQSNPNATADNTGSVPGFLVHYSPELGVFAGGAPTANIVKYAFRAHLVTYNTIGAVGSMVEAQANFVVTTGVNRTYATATWDHATGSISSLTNNTLF